MTIEIRTRSGWRPVSRRLAAPQVEETDRIEVRGSPGAAIWFGVAPVVLDPAGVGTLRLAEDPAANGHLGFMSVSDGAGGTLGEIEVIPGKVSQSAYEALRADLVRVWGDLIFDPTGVSALSARPPSAAELLARIERPLMQIFDQPAERLVVSTGVRRLDRVRSTREMRPAVVLAGMRGAPAMTRVLERSTDTPERQLVVATLQLLRQHARRDPEGAATVRRLDDLLRGPLAGAQATPVRSLTWGMRTDPRYRQVLSVYRMLNHPYLHATEGPGELRLGVRGMIRLYEYWVYLQVLLAARDLYGAPLGDGFDVLAVEQRGRTRRLELRSGTTVRFPGDVHIAFEPEIRSNGSGWMNIEYVPHPDPRREQFKATPDVVVFRGGDDPKLTVIDAKYVGRNHVEHKAVELHDKYARMRLRGRPLVDFVHAAHPHAGLSFAWAGYGHFGLTPGSPTAIPLPRVGRRSGDVRIAPPTQPVEPTGTGTEFVTIVADQFWMLRHLAGRRIVLSDLRTVLANGRPVHKSIIVMPDLPALQGFASAARRDGWEVQWASDVGREEQLDDLADLVEQRIDDGRVIVVSGDPELLERLPAYLVEVCSDLSAVVSFTDAAGDGSTRSTARREGPSDELIQLVQRLVTEVERPTPLEAIAWAVQKELGPEVAEDWGGFEKFKLLLQAACPDVQIDNRGPGHVIPPDVSWDDAAGVVPRDGGPLPSVVARLRRLDTSVPDVSGAAMEDLMAGVALALHPAVWSQLAISDHPFLGIRAVNALTLHVRDSFAAQDRHIARRHLDYILKVLLFAGSLQPGLSLSDVQSTLAERFAGTAAEKGYEVTESDKSEIREWLAGA